MNLFLVPAWVAYDFFVLLILITKSVYCAEKMTDFVDYI